MSGKVYAVASGKGGVGKTTSVVNVGVTLRAANHSVVLVDADLGMANLGTFLGIDHEPTIHDVLADEASIDDALIEQADRFAILPGSRDLRHYASTDPGALGGVLEALADRFEYVIVDTGAGMGFEDILPLELVDEVILVATPDRAALGDAAKTTEISELLGVDVRGVIVTMTDADDDVDAIADGLGAELLAAIPEDSAVSQSTAAGKPLEAFAPESAAAEEYRRAAATLAGHERERPETPLTAAETADERADSGQVADSDDESEIESHSSMTDDAPDELTDETLDEQTEQPESAERGERSDADEESPDEVTADVEAADASPSDTDDEKAAADESSDEGAAAEMVADESPADHDEEGESVDGEERSRGFLARLRGLFGNSR